MAGSVLGIQHWEAHASHACTHSAAASTQALVFSSTRVLAGSEEEAGDPVAEQSQADAHVAQVVAAGQVDAEPGVNPRLQHGV